MIHELQWCYRCWLTCKIMCICTEGIQPRLASTDADVVVIPRRRFANLPFSGEKAMMAATLSCIVNKVNYSQDATQEWKMIWCRTIYKLLGHRGGLAQGKVEGGKGHSEVKISEKGDAPPQLCDYIWRWSTCQHWSSTESGDVVMEDGRYLVWWNLWKWDWVTTGWNWK